MYYFNIDFLQFYLVVLPHLINLDFILFHCCFYNGAGLFINGNIIIILCLPFTRIFFSQVLIIIIITIIINIIISIY